MTFFKNPKNAYFSKLCKLCKLGLTLTYIPLGQSRGSLTYLGVPLSPERIRFFFIWLQNALKTMIKSPKTAKK